MMEESHVEYVVISGDKSVTVCLRSYPAHKGTSSESGILQSEKQMSWAGPEQYHDPQ